MPCLPRTPLHHLAQILGTPPDLPEIQAEHHTAKPITSKIVAETQRFLKLARALL
jgi:hypothetical protein